MWCFQIFCKPGTWYLRIIQFEYVRFLGNIFPPALNTSPIKYKYTCFASHFFGNLLAKISTMSLFFSDQGKMELGWAEWRGFFRRSFSPSSTSATPSQSSHPPTSCGSLRSRAPCRAASRCEDRICVKERFVCEPIRRIGAEKRSVHWKIRMELICVIFSPPTPFLFLRIPPTVRADVKEDPAKFVGNYLRCLRNVT